MVRKNLGSTGISLPALSFGASPLGGVFGEVTQAQADRAVRSAIDKGIDLFDTAPFYGLGRSESVLGNALRGVGRDRFVISTKVGRYGDRDFDFSEARIRRSVDESLLRLGVGHIDLLICHDIEFGDPSQIVDEALPAMRQLAEAGKARAIGISGYPLGIFPWVADRFDLDFVLSYCHLTLQDRRLAPMLEGFAERGIGVVNASPFGMGLLTEQGPPPWHPASRTVRAACADAMAWCASAGKPGSGTALAWSATQSGVATTLVGMNSAEQVGWNISALESGPDPATVAGMDAILAPVRDVGWVGGNWGNPG